MCPRCHLAPCEVENGSLAHEDYREQYNKVYRGILERNRIKELKDRELFDDELDKDLERLKECKQKIEEEEKEERKRTLGER